MTGPAKTRSYTRWVAACVCAGFLCAVSVAHAATMSVTVAQQTVSKGDTVLVDWYINTDHTPINVVDATLYYSPETLSVADISTGSSALILWIERPHVVTPGVIRFVGGIPGGANGAQIPILQTVLKAHDTGDATIALGRDATVVASDGAGTKMRLAMEPVVFPIVAATTAVVYSPSHPRQDHWYREDTVTFRIKETNAVAYSFSSNPEITPTDTPRVVTAPIVYADVPDGVYYFKLALPLNGALQEAQTYRVLIDHTAPSIVSAMIDPTSEVFNGNASLNVYAIDKTSGIAHIKVKTGWFGWYHEAASPYRLYRPLFGNVVTIKAIDKAGNVSLSTLYYRGYLANSISYCVTLGILLWISYSIIRKRNLICSLIQKLSHSLFSR